MHDKILYTTRHAELFSFFLSALSISRGGVFRGRKSTIYSGGLLFGVVSGRPGSFSPAPFQITQDQVHYLAEH